MVAHAHHHVSPPECPPPEEGEGVPARPPRPLGGVRPAGRLGQVRGIRVVRRGYPNQPGGTRALRQERSCELLRVDHVREAARSTQTPGEIQRDEVQALAVREELGPVGKVHRNAVRADPSPRRADQGDRVTPPAEGGGHVVSRELASPVPSSHGLSSEVMMIRIRGGSGPTSSANHTVRRGWPQTPFLPLRPRPGPVPARVLSGDAPGTKVASSARGPRP